MKRLTQKEEEIMSCFWTRGPLFIKELKEFRSNKDLHYNTLATIVKALEAKEFLNHEQFGNTYRYFPVIAEEDYKSNTIGKVVSKYFNNSYRNVVSHFVKDKNLSIDELKKLINDIEKNKNEE